MAGSIYGELLKFAENLEPWQRDALRRHTESPTLSDAEINELTDIAYAAALAGEKHLVDDATEVTFPDAVPLAEVHVPSTSSAAPSVGLKKVRHIQGVNRMSPGAAITLKPTGLNIVFGLNGVGKSGYTRILKRSCHSKYPEAVQGDVFAAGTIAPQAEIEYLLGDDDLSHEWTLSSPSTDLNLSRVAVYDSKTATAHVSRQGTELTVTPDGLELLTSLIATYDLVTTEVRRRVSVLKAEQQPGIVVDAADIEVKNVLSLLGKNFGYAAAEALGKLTDEEAAELTALPAEIGHLKTNSRAARLAKAQHDANQRTTQARRIENLAAKVCREQIQVLQGIRKRLQEIASDEAASQKHDFTAEAVPGVHSPHWKAMWAAAKEYAEAEAYPEHIFPDAAVPLCVLCHQPLTAEVHDRFTRFSQAMAADLSAEHRKLTTQAEKIVAGIDDAVSPEKIDEALLNLLAVEGGGFIQQLRQDMANVKELRDILADSSAAPETVDTIMTPFMDGASVSDGSGVPVDGYTIASSLMEAVQELDKAAAEYLAQVTTVQEEGADGAELAALEARYLNLSERSRVGMSLPNLKALHNRRIHINALGAVQRQCQTRGLSEKSKAVCAEYVQKVAEEFQRNLWSLEDPDLPGESRLQVELIADKVGKGISNIAFTVKGTATTKAKTHADGVLSEGELRAVSLSAFLADVVSSEDGSAIIFDDPMNSLDHGFQERVAKRLVKEARNRQVIVFTHSTAFMGALWYEGVKKDINAQAEDGITSPQPVETHFIEIDKHPGLGTGIQVAESKEPIKGYLGTTAMADKLIGQAKQHHENGDMTAYSRDCMEFGNTIRKAWEYAVEEVVINGVVARNKPGVSTMNLKALLALGRADIAAVDKGMEVSNLFVHSTGSGWERSLPQPSQLRSRLSDLQTWVKDFRKRKEAIL
ncbi:AAA family ATPase [Arthrobacter crystallopoietes]|uniref:AAA family ATPase n=1 Tax=Crystallibacter crystallopoietes TaxID=37928 RepID=UPI001ABDADC6|nr:AAA family ATPase [Arthrobacter crystallopoietes]QTG81752.1 AAA family ATPase [Arthrobacter crystallopoietes]